MMSPETDELSGGVGSPSIAREITNLGRSRPREVSGKGATREEKKG